MKITIYELLGLIKDGKAPKKIKYCGYIYEWEDDWYLTKEKNCRVCLGGKSGDINQLYNAFNDNVEILLDEEDEFIDIEELSIFEHNNSIETNKGAWTGRNLDKALAYKINEIIKNQKQIIARLKDGE